MAAQEGLAGEHLARFPQGFRQGRCRATLADRNGDGSGHQAMCHGRMLLGPWVREVGIGQEGLAREAFPRGDEVSFFLRVQTGPAHQRVLLHHVRKVPAIGKVVQHLRCGGDGTFMELWGGDGDRCSCVGLTAVYLGIQWQSDRNLRGNSGHQSGIGNPKCLKLRVLVGTGSSGTRTIRSARSNLRGTSGSARTMSCSSGYHPRRRIGWRPHRLPHLKDCVAGHA